MDGPQPFLATRPLWRLTWQLIRPKKDALSVDRKCTMLYTAARAGHLELVKFLVDEKDCSVNKKNGENESTPLHGAAFGGHHQVVQFLVDSGAQLHANAYGDTPLDDCENSEASAAAKKKCRTILTAVKATAAAAPASPPKKKIERQASASGDKLDEAAVRKMTVPQLRAKCGELGLPATGAKAALTKTLLDHLKGGAAPTPAPAADEPPTKKAKPAPKAAPSTDGGDSSAGGDDLLNPMSAASIAELRSATVSFSKIPKDTEEFWDMEEKFAASLQGRNEDYVQNRIKAKKKPLTFILVGCEKVKNDVLARRFERRKKVMQKEGSELARERVSFHGSADKNLPSICRTSLLRFKHPLNPCKEQVDDGYFGTNLKGVYVSRYSDYTFKYAKGLEALDEGQTAKTIMFRTLPGKSKHIPKLSMSIPPTPGFHSHSSPSYLEWYLFNEDQLLPEYVLEVKAVLDTRTASDDE
eukprot:TRINITY_DN5014_c0_g1_i3.p1 TRINITY_DN5014_c0_g1~~TRINITY_DN5014_c0_g1_i3.p1  ORF type:complete len:470 (-),score=121.49 TRINITY_DN5014_c0_g1_i3:96-1505(-)